MSNIQHLQTELLPTMLSKFEVLYGLKSVDDKNTLRQVIEQVDDVLFQDYLKRKRETLQNITETGLLGPGVNPLSEVRPSGKQLAVYGSQVFISFSHRCATLHAQGSAMSG
jgi:exocyst complex component 2